MYACKLLLWMSIIWIYMVVEKALEENLLMDFVKSHQAGWESFC